MYKLSVCGIAKNEQHGLREWVNYHRLVGVEHFYIYDNDSTVPVRETLAKEIATKYVTCIEYPGPSKQMPAYTDCLNRFGQDNEWIAFIDCDEFLLPKGTDNVYQIVDQYSNYGSLQVNWIIFGSNGHIERPSGLVIESYTKGTAVDWVENLHTKAIVQPKYTQCAGTNPHHFRHHPGYIAIDEQFRQVPNAWSQTVSVDRIQINHYTTKSLEDWKMKVAKGRADAAHLSGRSLHDLAEIDAPCTIEYTDILRFVRPTKQLLGR